MVKLKIAGFTIVETMIFLAVSGVIFVSVVLLLQGQLNRYQSRDAMNQLESNVRGVLNDVSNGYYPIMPNNYTCTGAVNNDLGRGSNTNCVFAGKSVTFSEDSVDIDTWVTPFGTNVLPSGIANEPEINKISKVDGLKETKNYQWAINPVSNTTFYILNTIYSTENTDNFISGAQSVKLFKNDSLNIVPVTGINDDNKVCFNNGGHKSSLTFGVNGALTAFVTFKDEDC
jgi:type II secretory pathway pseudopilin PulG